MSFGGFGLNYAAVGPVRESALDYLEFALESDGSPALHAVSIMQNLLHHFLNRVGRRSTEQEKDWQNRERERCLQALLRRYAQAGSPILKARIYNALRSATAINCPEPIRQSCHGSSCKYCGGRRCCRCGRDMHGRSSASPSFNRLYGSRVGTTHYRIDDEGAIQPRTPRRGCGEPGSFHDRPDAGVHRGSCQDGRVSSVHVCIRRPARLPSRDGRTTDRSPADWRDGGPSLFGTEFDPCRRSSRVPAEGVDSPAIRSCSRHSRFGK